MTASGTSVSALAAPGTPAAPSVVMLPGQLFVAGCARAGAGLFLLGRVTTLPLWLLAAEVLATILGLFLFGSFKYQIHKNALTYGMLMVIAGTFTGLSTSGWHVEIATGGWWAWVRLHLLSFGGLDDLLHADTMLFILGLTFFVSVIAQTRLLEGITLTLLRRNRGSILPTVIAVTGVVAIASGVLDGVSMIGLTIRTLVIVMTLAAAPPGAIRYAVMVCTAVTTICGIWLAYGEPPNLIMKANLFPHLENAFFLLYCAPAAVAAYVMVAVQLRQRLGGIRVNVDELDILDAHAADVRFLQATRHGEVLTPVELVEAHSGDAAWGERLKSRILGGETLGLAMIDEDVPQDTRRLLLGHFVAEELADGLDRHYVLAAAGEHEAAFRAELAVGEVLAAMGRVRRRAQRIGALALVPFAAMLVLHGVHHEIPLFLASFAGFLAALPAIAQLPKMRALAVREAWLEYSEYYFLFPLFLSITLLTTAGFFEGIREVIQNGIAMLGHAHVAFIQFLGSTFLSAILDNNVVADFASRGLDGLDLHLLRLFAMAQIAGYALGGCWTHIGCAQSVVAYAFIQRDLDKTYTPVQWIKEMTPVIMGILLVMGVIIYAESAIVTWMYE
jgi:Na+/H+ antiporter NhaD/arsenite permease-like protein